MTKFTPELFTTICERIAEGESQRHICLDDDMPSHKSVRAWINNDGTGKIGKQYAQACSDRAAHIFEECLDIADSATNDTFHQDRLRVDTRKWMVGKMQPKKYGDRIQQDIGGEGFKVVIGDKDAGGL